MENIYIFFVVILILLAISDLVVGVSNDAVNFLSSAIGSKAAKFGTILIIASIGVIAGAMFSNGMMEVARKGIFNPEYFSLSEIMIVFLAVMITDVVLLDIFNSYGLPTSTTVSLVFELLGAAVAVAIIKVSKNNLNYSEMANYINTAKALVIISGIFLSVVTAFISGIIVQYIVRLVFGFNLKKTFKKFAAIWGGVAVTSIVYFLLISGAKGSTLISKEQISWMQDHAYLINLISFVGFTMLFQLLVLFTKIDILKITVLLGTFALAMAFAGNDLVNFIGVPIAGLLSVQHYIAEGATNPDLFQMSYLNEKIQIANYILLSAGMVMVLTLWFSKKAKKVTATTLNLSRQEEGVERFGSSAVSRSIVRLGIQLTDFLSFLLPNKVVEKMKARYIPSEEPIDKEVSFDLLRASVNLVVASILIAFATSHKLPLSTTYVTFMVAMGTSLADGAWGRESAVYRVTGVLTVISGWFFTAFIAFISAFVLAYIIYWGGIYGVIVLLSLAVFFVFRTHFRRKNKTNNLDTSDSLTPLNTDGKTNIIHNCKQTINKTLSQSMVLYNKSIIGLSEEDRKILRESSAAVKELNEYCKGLKNKSHDIIKSLENEHIESGHYYVQEVDYLREIAHCLSFIINPINTHVNNNHKGLIVAQKEELNQLSMKIDELFIYVQKVISSSHYDELDVIIQKQGNILTELDLLRKSQLKRIKHDIVGTKNSMLYLGILHETKNMLLYLINLVKAHRDFDLHTQDNSK